MVLSLPMAAAGIAATSMTGLTGLLLLVGGVGDATAHTGLLAGSVCATSGPIAGISDTAAANGRVVAAVSVARGGDQAALIALMVGLTESGLRVLANPNDPAGNAFPHDGVGSDHASLGIFQQQPWWGTAAQRMEPVASTNLFLDRLLSLPHWQTAPPWQAAQSVQASAFSDGSNFHGQMDPAISILNAVKAGSAALKCDGSGIGQPPPGPTGAALPGRPGPDPRLGRHSRLPRTRGHVHRRRPGGGGATHRRRRQGCDLRVADQRRGVRPAAHRLTGPRDLIWASRADILRRSAATSQQSRVVALLGGLPHDVPPFAYSLRRR